MNQKDTTILLRQAGEQNGLNIRKIKIKNINIKISYYQMMNNKSLVNYQRKNKRKVNLKNKLNNLKYQSYMLNHLLKD